MLHAHIETYSTDCDGAISRDYVMTMDDDEKSGEFGDIRFHERVIASVVNTYSIMATGTLTVTRTEKDVRLTWNEPTEEGGRNIDARICNDDCDTTESHYRDHAAEAAGY